MCVYTMNVSQYIYANISYVRVYIYIYTHQLVRDGQAATDHTSRKLRLTVRAELEWSSSWCWAQKSRSRGLDDHWGGWDARACGGTRFWNRLWLENISMIRSSSRSRVNGTIWRSPVYYTWKWISHVTHMNESCHTKHFDDKIIFSLAGKRNNLMESRVLHVEMDESCHTCRWVLSHIWRSHVTHVEESCHTYEWVMSHIWMSHATHMNESCHTYEWVMSHTWRSHVTHMDESCHTYECVMSHIWLSLVTHMNELWHTYEWVLAHTWMSFGTHMNDSFHTLQCDISYTWMRHVPHIWRTCGWVMSTQTQTNRQTDRQRERETDR